MADGQFSTSAVYVKGIVVSGTAGDKTTPTKGGSGDWKLHIADTANGTTTLYVFYATPASGITNVSVGDTVVVYGFIEMYSSAVQMYGGGNSGKAMPQLVSVTPASGSGNQGNQGDQGNQGNQGNQGDQGNQGNQGGTSGYYVKVTSTSQMVSGAKYLIVYEGGKVALDGSLSEDKASNTQAVTITSNGIEATAALANYSFTITAVTGGYAIKAASGQYIYNSSSERNQLNYSADQQVVEIAFTGSDVDIMWSSRSYYLRYNNTEDQMRFSFYKAASYTNQQAIQLYMLVED